jgi:putative transposase
LGQTTPATHYTPSPRSYPARLEDPEYPADYQLRRVRHTGEIKWQNELVFLSEPLANEVIGVVETNDGDAEVYFGPMMLGLIDGVSLKLRRHTPASSSTVRREGQPPSPSSPSNSEKVLPIMPV